MNVEDIISEYLKENGYDGLYNSDGPCGCAVGDLAPCCSLNMDCEPGHKRQGCSCGEGCNWEIWPGKRSE